MCYKSASSFKPYVQTLKSPEVRMFLKGTSRIIQEKYPEEATGEGKNSRESCRFVWCFFFF